MPFGEWCCCDCDPFYDTFDCCLLADSSTMDPKCWDEYGFVATQDLGPGWDWQSASGEWWKDESPVPQYAPPPCDDGALYELTGSGLLRCRVGCKNQRAYTFQCDLLALAVNQKFVIHFCETDARGDGVDVECWVKAESLSSFLIELTALGTVVDVTISNDPSLLHTFSITWSKFWNILCVAIDRPAISLPNILICDVDLSGWLFSIENTGGVAAVWDNVLWDVRYGLSGIAAGYCYTCGLCTCLNVDAYGVTTFWRDYSKTMHLHVTLDEIASPFRHAEIDVDLVSQGECMQVGNTWQSTPIQI